MLDIISIHDGHSLCVVHVTIIITIIIKVLIIYPAITIPVRTVNLSRFNLSQLHENDGTFGNDRVDNKGGKDHDENGAERKTEMALASLNIAIGVFQEEVEGLAAAKTSIHVLLDLIWHDGCF